MFVSRRVKVVERRVVGQTAPGHLKLTLIDGPTRWDAIGFGMGNRIGGVSEHIDIAYTVERNTWNGNCTDQLRLSDFAATT
jgi:single-stranded DNA-specific DHH superfamily exonuclease